MSPKICRAGPAAFLPLCGSFHGVCPLPGLRSIPPMRWAMMANCRPVSFAINSRPAAGVACGDGVEVCAPDSKRWPPRLVATR